VLCCKGEAREVLNRGANQAPDTCPSIHARGFWKRQKSVYFNIRLCHPNANSCNDLTSKLLYKQQEQKKKRKYVIRVIEVEQGTFTLLVSSTTGGMGEEFIRYHYRLAELLAIQKIQTYSTTISWIRARVSFALLSGALSTHVEKCPRGLRAGLKKVLMCGL